MAHPSIATAPDSDASSNQVATAAAALSVSDRQLRPLFYRMYSPGRGEHPVRKQPRYRKVFSHHFGGCDRIKEEFNAGNSVLPRTNPLDSP